MKHHFKRALYWLGVAAAALASLVLCYGCTVLWICAAG